MDEDFFNNELIENFEQMLDNREYKYYDSEDLIEIIEFYIDVNDNEYAKRALEYAEKLHPDNLDIKIKRIDYLLFNNNLKEASSKIKNLKEIASNNIDFLLVEARFWGMKNIPKKAIRLYEEALKIDDEETDFICNCIGNEYLNMGEIHSGLVAFKKALKYNPENDYSFYSIIQCYDEINNEKDYHEFLKDHIDDNPYSEAAWLHLGLLYNTQKKYNEAVNSFDYVIAINPSSITGHVHKAIALDSLGKYNDAITTLEETLEFDDSPATTYLKIGELYQKLNKPQDALKSYHICIKEDPQLDKAWANVASIYNQLSNLKDAEHYIDRAIELDNKNVNYYRSSVEYLLKQNKFEKAIDRLEKLIELDPLTFSTWFSYIKVLINIKEYEHAIAIITDGALKNFNRAELFYQLSKAYYETNQEQLGEEALAKALLLNQSIKDDMFEAYPILQEKIINLKHKPF